MFCFGIFLSLRFPPFVVLSMDAQLLERLATDEDWQEVRKLLDAEDIKAFRMALLAAALKGLDWHPSLEKLAKSSGLSVQKIRTILKKSGQ
jgi:hypothetical protein